MATHGELSDFLADVERRAFRQALFAVHNEETALDLVQDAMLRLTEKYSGRPVAELPMLFQRILQNAIRDFYRRQKVRSTWTVLFSSLTGGDDEDGDPLETLGAAGESNLLDTPHEHLERYQVVELIDKEVKKLPPRQREAFLMRYWEELDISETARAMGCSEGSVKTHCFRAVQALAGALKAKGIKL
ncbi:MAG: RNA polymerase sigma factor [Proteobacteria bacterium]|nr:RNA polymerase sigma factor [Pseudomonadota bacterium]HQR02882.1 RNA polymerase sigma factor [Rhodocyclaceae bacterium]